mmetsp:Transcript_45355/g.119051  ORF Transcript_45355/g.119051 Transcript_45355/m.119051 type:complete len:220 (-) Transcript_45355:752-1411(-)
MPLVEAPRRLDRHPLHLELVEHEPGRLDGTLQVRREHPLQPRAPSLAQQRASKPRLLAPAVGQLDVCPAGEAIFSIELGVAMAHDDQARVRRRHRRRFAPLALRSQIAHPQQHAVVRLARLARDPFTLERKVRRRPLTHVVATALVVQCDLLGGGLGRPRVTRRQLVLAVARDSRHRNVLHALLAHRVLRLLHHRRVHKEGSSSRDSGGAPEAVDVEGL